jgi:hypothetical protein
VNVILICLFLVFVYCHVFITSISCVHVVILRYVGIDGRITGFSKLKQEGTWWESYSVVQNLIAGSCEHGDETLHKCGEYFIIWATVSFKRWTLLHWVSYITRSTSFWYKCCTVHLAIDRYKSFSFKGPNMAEIAIWCFLYPCSFCYRKGPQIAQSVQWLIYRLDNRGWFLSCWEISLLQRVQTSSELHPTSCPTYTGPLSLGFILVPTPLRFTTRIFFYFNSALAIILLM